MPLPFALDHINLWLLRDRLDGRDGWTIVDCGISNDTIQANWEKVFANELEGSAGAARAGHAPPPRPRRPGGLAVQALGRAPVDEPGRLHERARHGRRQWCRPNAGGDFAASHFARHGLNDPDSLEKLRARKSYYPSLVPDLPTQYRRLMDGDTVAIGADPASAGWRVITGYGHARPSTWRCTTTPPGC